jgi:hypothetical protein
VRYNSTIVHLIIFTRNVYQGLPFPLTDLKTNFLEYKEICNVNWLWQAAGVTVGLSVIIRADRESRTSTLALYTPYKFSSKFTKRQPA